MTFLTSSKHSTLLEEPRDPILSNYFRYILEKFSRHTHFIIVPQNQWNLIDFTGSIVLEYNF